MKNLFLFLLCFLLWGAVTAQVTVPPRKITINGVQQDLLADRTWTVTAVPDSFTYATIYYVDSILAAIGGGGLTSDSLNNLTDVHFTSLVTGQLIRYNNTTKKWENFTPTYLSAESDPVFLASVAYNITTTDTTHYNTAWLKYITGGSFAGGTITYTRLDGTTFTVTGIGTLTAESDPVFVASVAHAITALDTTHYNTSWLKYIVSGSYATGTATFTRNDATTFTVTGFNTGTVTNIATTYPLTGGPITTTGTVAIPKATTHVAGYLDTLDWQTFNSKGSGSVTSVGLSVPSVFSVSPTPITTSGTFALVFNGGQTQNQFLGTPNGGSGAVGLRAIVAADIPTLNQNTSGSAATLTTPRAINGVNFDGSAAITVTAAGSTLTGSTLASGITGSSLTSVATLTGGTWNASVIGPLYGGTGVANNAAATVTSSGNFGYTRTLTGTTNVTFPTSGTLVNTAVTALTSLVSISTITTGVWNATAIDATYLNIGMASITGASGAINTVETVIAKTGALAANRLAAGTVIRITLLGTCTSSAANTSTFSVRIGTAGTTSDGLMAQAVSSVAATTGTSIPFRMVFELTVRTTGSGATDHGFCTLENTGTTGISAVNTQVILPTFTTFNTTTASNIISVTYKAALATTTSTFQDAIIEIVYK